MLLRFSLNADAAADSIERAVSRALEAGHRTRDLAGDAVSTDEMGSIIAGYISEEK